MSEPAHWIYNLSLSGHNLTFNLDTIFTMWFAMAVVIIFAILATRKLSLVPGKLQAVSESILKFFWGTLDTMIPNKNRQHVPLVASLFLFILIANLMGQLPLRIIHLKSGGELASPTNDINVTAALAIIVLIYYVAIRLFANVFAGEILVSIALGLYAYFLPLPIMLFELLVAFIQATVFMMLTIAYISSASGEEH